MMEARKRGKIAFVNYRTLVVREPRRGGESARHRQQNNIAQHTTPHHHHPANTNQRRTAATPPPHTTIPHQPTTTPSRPSTQPLRPATPPPHRTTTPPPSPLISYTPTPIPRSIASTSSSLRRSLASQTPLQRQRDGDTMAVDSGVDMPASTVTHDGGSPVGASGGLSLPTPIDSHQRIRKQPDRYQSK